jgi:hypothetical protein
MHRPYRLPSLSICFRLCMQVAVEGSLVAVPSRPELQASPLVLSVHLFVLYLSPLSHLYCQFGPMSEFSTSDMYVDRIYLYPHLTLPVGRFSPARFFKRHCPSRLQRERYWVEIHVRSSSDCSRRSFRSGAMAQTPVSESPSA